MNEFNTHQVRFKVVIKIIFTGLGKTKNYKTWVKNFHLLLPDFPLQSTYRARFILRIAFRQNENATVSGNTRYFS